MGTTQVEAEAAGNGRYTVRGSYLSLAAPWQILVILRRPGFDDVTHTFTVHPGLPAAQ
jgi:hypothetical protein